MSSILILLYSYTSSKFGINAKYLLLGPGVCIANKPRRRTKSAFIYTKKKTPPRSNVLERDQDQYKTTT